jgi:hypothetical protein
LNLSLITTAVVANAVTEFSFWIEIPFFICNPSFYEIIDIYGKTNCSVAPSIKFVIAEQQWAETLGTGSSKTFINAGRTCSPYTS